MKPIQRCYHGTTREAAALLLRYGIKKGTYLARHLEDAIYFGGPVVITVDLPENSFTDWQWRTPKRILPSKIYSVTEHRIKRTYVSLRLERDDLRAFRYHGKQKWQSFHNRERER